MSPLLTALTALAMCALVPLGLRLVSTRLPPPMLWMAAGVAGVAGLIAPRGTVAVLLVAPYAALCMAAAVLAALRFVTSARTARTAPHLLVREAVAATALVSLAVAGGSLLAERAGIELLGFDMVTLRLTVLHFHYAGFAASLVAGHTAAAWPSRLSQTGAVAVPVGLLTVLGGFFVGEWAEFAGAVVLTGGLLATAATVLINRRALRPRPRRLLLIAAATLPATMLLAISWAAGEAADLPHLTLGQTAASHGLANALCAGLCGLLGWRSADRPPL